MAVKKQHVIGILLGGILESWCHTSAEMEAVKDLNPKDLGVQWMGGIIHPHKKQRAQNVILLKIVATKSVRAFKQGMILGNKYTIVDIISADHFVVSLLNEDSGTPQLAHVRKAGFLRGNSNPQLTDELPVPEGVNYGQQETYKEEGFERNKSSIEVSGHYRDKMVDQELGKILMQASAEPVFVDGSIIGFMLDQIDPTSLYAKAGLIDGDIVTTINDAPLDNVTTAIKLLQSLKKAASVNFEIKRGASTMPMSVSVK